MNNISRVKFFNIRNYLETVMQETHGKVTLDWYEGYLTALRNASIISVLDAQELYDYAKGMFVLQ
jgi:hypothetical protein